MIKLLNDNDSSKMQDFLHAAMKINGIIVCNNPIALTEEVAEKYDIYNLRCISYDEYIKRRNSDIHLELEESYFILDLEAFLKRNFVEGFTLNIEE